MGLFGSAPKQPIYKDVDVAWIEAERDRFKPNQNGYKYWGAVAESARVNGGYATITNQRVYATEEQRVRGMFTGSGDLGGGWSVVSYGNPNQSYMDQMSEAMSAQAEAQARYMEQMQALNQAQLEMQQEAAKAANVESSKNPSDFTGANAADVARKQMLRRGLMSTYTRYDSGAQPSAKSAKLGG